MLTLTYEKLEAGDKLVYFEAATNPILKKLLTEELEQTQNDILTLEKRNEETAEDFILRFKTIKIKYALLTDFLTINENVVKEIQNL